MCNYVEHGFCITSGALTLAYFFIRELVKKMVKKDDEFLVLSYSRKVLGQTGSGHFSPVGGYHSQNDLVLILDTARFKYPPHWVPLTLVCEAMRALDTSIGKFLFKFRL